MLFRSDRKSTRLNSSHLVISYAVFCLKKKKKHEPTSLPQQTHSDPIPHGDPRRPSRIAVVGPLVVTVAGSAGRCSLPLFFFFLRGGPPRISPFSPTPPFSQ